MGEEELYDSSRGGTSERQPPNHPREPSRPPRTICLSGELLFFLLGQGPTQIFDVVETNVATLQTSPLVRMPGVEGLGLGERCSRSAEGSSAESVDVLCGRLAEPIGQPDIDKIPTPCVPRVEARLSQRERFRSFASDWFGMGRNWFARILGEGGGGAIGPLAAQ